MIVRCLSSFNCPLHQLLQRTSPKPLAEFDKTRAERSINGSVKYLFQMVPVDCISRSHGLKIDFRKENLPETKALMFGL